MQVSFQCTEWMNGRVNLPVSIETAKGGEIDHEFRSQQTTITGDTLCQVNKYSLSTLI